MGARPGKVKHVTQPHVSLQEPSWQNVTPPWDLKQINFSENTYMKTSTHYLPSVQGQEIFQGLSLSLLVSFILKCSYIYLLNMLHFRILKIILFGFQRECGPLHLLWRRSVVISKLQQEDRHDSYPVYGKYRMETRIRVQSNLLRKN